MKELRNSDLPNLITQRNQVKNGEKYFIDFLIALIQVKSEYLIWPYGVNENVTQMGERVFAYELYHQWRKVTEQFNYKNLIINGEIRKDSSLYNHLNIGQVYPDLVLHEQQSNKNQQRIVCEIKTSKALGHSNGRKQLRKDLVKLSNFRRDLNFDYCIFLQILNVEDCLNTSLLPYLRRVKNQLNDLEFIFLVIKDNDSVRYDTLQNIINADLR